MAALLLAAFLVIPAQAPTLAAAPAPTVTSPAAGETVPSTLSRVTFTGTGLPSYFVNVSVVSGGSILVCEAQVDGTGNWTCTGQVANANIDTGEATVSVTQTQFHGANSPSDGRVSVTFTLDLPGPVVTTPGATVSTQLPIFTGTATKGAGTTSVEIGVSGQPGICIALVLADGSWKCQASTPLTQGSTYTARFRLAESGNYQGGWVDRTFTVDATSPTLNALPDPVLTSTPTFSGAAAPDYYVGVYDGTTLLCSTRADASGNWSCTSAVSMTDGAHDLVVREAMVATDVRTATGDFQSSVATVNVAAVPFTMTSPATGATVTTTKPTFSGTAAPGSVVTINNGVAIVGAPAPTLCTATADEAGNWSCTSTTDLSSGSYSIRATTPSSVGPPNMATATITVSPASTNPGTTPGSTPGTTPGTSSRAVSVAQLPTVISTRRPVLSGTAAAGATVQATENGDVLCSDTVAADRTWSCKTQVLGPGWHNVTIRVTSAKGEHLASEQLRFRVAPTPRFLPHTGF